MTDTDKSVIVNCQITRK